MGAITASSDYTQTNTCPASGSPLGAGANCTVTITFAPQFAGKIGGSVSIAYTGTNSPQFVSLSGASVAPLTLSPTKLTFSTQAVGSTSAPKPVKITNNSASAITLSSVVPSADFQIQLSGTTCPLSGGSLGGGKTCTLEIQFAPKHFRNHCGLDHRAEHGKSESAADPALRVRRDLGIGHSHPVVRASGLIGNDCD